MGHRFDRRLQRLEAQADAGDGPDGPGLAALLAWANQHPHTDDEDAETDEEDGAPSPLGLLLQEARAWLAQQGPPERGGTP